MQSSSLPNGGIPCIISMLNSVSLSYVCPSQWKLTSWHTWTKLRLYTGRECICCWSQWYFLNQPYHSTVCKFILIVHDVLNVCKSQHVQCMQGFIQDFKLGGREQNGSRMIVVCVATRGVWGHIPPSRKILNLDPLRLRLRLRLTQSVMNLISKQCILATIITILNFKISRGGIPGPPPLCMKPWYVHLWMV